MFVQHLVSLTKTAAESFDSLADRNRFTHHFFVQYLIAFCSRLEAASCVISGSFVGPVVSDERVKYGDLHLTLSQAILPEAV